MSGVSFLREGLANPEIGKWDYSHYPYSVRPNLRKVPTLQEAEESIIGMQKASLSERVQPVSGKPHLAYVDQFFIVRSQTKAPTSEALKLWSHLRSQTQKIGIGSGIGAIGLAFFAFWGAPIYIEVALLVGIVAACCFAGWSFQRYHTAEKQLAVWRSPAEDFALRRNASLELPLDKISEQKCHYHLDQPGGTLLGIEIFCLLKHSFKQFAEPLLARKCDSPDQQHQWVADFFTSNPLMINFVRDNPHLAGEKEWQAVIKFQEQMILLQEMLENIKSQYTPQLPKSMEFARIQWEGLKSLMEGKADEASKTLELDSTTAERYQKMVLQALYEEHLVKIYILIQQHQIKTKFFYSLVYSQVRVLLEQASVGLLEQKPFTLDPDAFTDLNKVIPDFSQELQAIAALFPQNVIVKARSLFSADLEYQQFIDEVFKP